MFFSKTLVGATFVLAASALPQGSPSSTTSSAPSSSSSGSAGGGGGGGGSVNIINNLGETVKIQSTASTTGSDGTKTLNSGGGSYSENYKTTSDGSGISIKMSTGEGENSVLQFEYTNDGDNLYWDLSSIDLDPNSAFVKGGFSATSDDSSCKPASCTAGDADCAQSYQHPDDKNTNSCSAGSSFTVTLG